VSEWVGEEEVQRRSDLYSFSRPAGIFKQSVGATNRAGMVVVPARQATQPGGIGSLASILGFLKRLKNSGSLLKFITT
jgi:hypothetical protein